MDNLHTSAGNIFKFQLSRFKTVGGVHSQRNKTACLLRSIPTTTKCADANPRSPDRSDERQVAMYFCNRLLKPEVFQKTDFLFNHYAARTKPKTLREGGFS